MSEDPEIQKLREMVAKLEAEARTKGFPDLEPFTRKRRFGEPVAPATTTYPPPYDSGPIKKPAVDSAAFAKDGSRSITPADGG